MKILSVINQKGGVGKTTTCINVGADLADRGYKVLLIDLDAQGNLTSGMGIPIEDDTPTVYEVLKGVCDINKAIVECGDSLWILPADIRLSGADMELSGVPGRDSILKEAISQLNIKFDYIIIDCAPSLGIIPLMALTAADGIIIPVQAQYPPLKGLSQLTNTIDLVKKRMNPSLDIIGVLLTMYNHRRILDRKILNNIQQAFPDQLFKTTISTNIALAEAPSCGVDIHTYNPDSMGSEQYTALTDEILERMN